MNKYTLSTKNIWFPKKKEPVYDPQDQLSVKKFKEYWKKEKKLCKEGFFLADGQVFVPGPLYFHTVYAKIAMYVERIDAKGVARKSRIVDNPYLRDIDWDIFQDLQKCEEQGKFYSLVGSRDFGKSQISASRAAHQYTFYKKSETVISGGQANYIKLATDKIEDILINLHPALKKQRLASDWKKEILAGWKDKQSNQPDPKSSFSSIKVRNYENGNKTMAANGTRPGFQLIDEIGTIPNFIGCMKDSDGCWWSGDGDKPSCLVMVCGTGGNAEVGAEAAEVFFNPEAYNMLEFENPETSGKMGRFITALRAKMKFKEPKTLGEYLGIDHPDLNKITILVSNEERALKEWWEPEYAKALKSGNSKKILGFKAYWPLVPSDSFLVLTSNDYNVPAAKAQQTRLRQQAIDNGGFVGTPVRLYHDGTKVVHEFTDKMPITEYPLKTQSADAPVIIYEFPVTSPPWGLYIAGIDPYRTSKSDDSDSLGSVYIFKRMHSINTEGYQDMFVASYTARPERLDDWQDQARMLIKYYNALAFCENDEMSFINYMINKGDGHMLSDVPQWLKEMLPYSTAAKNRDKGVHSSEKTIRFYRSCLKNYLDQVVYTDKDEKGSVIAEHLGVTKVLDGMLLEEIIKFNKDGNFDRERAASICIAAAMKMEPIGKIDSLEPDNRLVSLYKRTPNTRLFVGDRNPFRRPHPTTKRNKMFK